MGNPYKSVGKIIGKMVDVPLPYPIYGGSFRSCSWLLSAHFFWSSPIVQPTFLGSKTLFFLNEILKRCLLYICLFACGCKTHFKTHPYHVGWCWFFHHISKNILPAFNVKNTQDECDPPSLLKKKVVTLNFNSTVTILGINPQYGRVQKLWETPTIH